MLEAHDRFKGEVDRVGEHPLLGRYVMRTEDGHPVPGDDNGRPDPLVMAVVVAVVNELREHGSSGKWLGANLFVPDTSARASLTELDLAVLERIGMLADVCRRPEARLDHETHLVRTGLARRVPPAGLARLASHSEDWGGIEHGELQPLRVLSTRYVDDFDFYENRVAAQLVDRLDEHLRKRLRELALLAAGIADLEEYDRALGNRQSWRKHERTARLIAAAVEDRAASTAAIRESADTFTKLRTRLRILFGSTVMRQANRRIRLPLRLVRTNLFVNERRYRKVGELWEMWAVYETATADRRREDDAGFFNAYNTYVALLTIRALIILGYALDENRSLPGADVPVRLRRNGEVLVCTIDRAGVLTISVDGEALTRVVPLSHDLTAPVPDHTRQKWINQIRGVENTIIVYPGVRDERRQLAPEVRSVLHSSQRGIVPISPVEIEGEERLARALRWPLQAARYVSGYPVVLSAQVKLPDVDWYRAGERGKVEILRRPDDAELAALTAANKSGSPRRRGDDELRHFIDQLGEADRRLAVLDTCPLCPSGRAVMTARRDGTFVCRCDSCSTTWGLNPCGNCRERYPFLWPRNAVVNTEHSDRLDMTAGADLLAEPCAAPSDQPVPRFRCCWCDHCTGAPNCGCVPRPGHTFAAPERS
ncbi:hypothetical protein [Lentzea californiensis]|uniref:hypothetical protein n=1 Tax=Lentzea californiensis TaxID=438851 RepID=UPI002165BD3B|nr:hypothetical protein [Lentzea californiensis]MCR3753717.1 hypothetical protein [Lentzea californiensis]